MALRSHLKIAGSVYKRRDKEGECCNSGGISNNFGGVGSDFCAVRGRRGRSVRKLFHTSANSGMAV
jgi:hypothetical protein